MESEGLAPSHASVAPIITKVSEDRATESWSCPSLAAASERADPATHSGSTGEWGLKAWDQKNWTSPPTSYAIRSHEWGKNADSYIPWHLRQSGDMTLLAWEWESWLCPSPTAALGKAGPSSSKDKTVELNPVMWVWMSRSWRSKRRRTGPFLAACFRGWAGKVLESLPWWWQWGKASGLTKQGITQVQNQGYGIAHPNIYFIDLLLQRQMQKSNVKIHVLHDILGLHGLI